MDCQSKETAAMKDKLGIDFHCKITFNFSQNEILYNWEILSSAHSWLSKWVTSIILNWECISIKRVIVGISLKLIIKCIMGEVIQFTAEVPFPSSFGQLLHLFYLLRRGWGLQLADLYITIDTVQTTDRHELELGKVMEYNREKNLVLKGLGTKYSCQVVILPL